MTGPLVVLVGPMGVGKSTVGQLLAERLGVAYRDTDDDIVAAQGRDDRRDLRRRGRAGLPRDREGRRCGRRSPSTTASSRSAAASILDADTRALLAGQRVVYLSMDVEEAVKRTGLNAARPLLAVNPRKQWRELMEARRHLYDRGRHGRRRHRRPHPRRGHPSASWTHWS